MKKIIIIGTVCLIVGLVLGFKFIPKYLGGIESNNQNWYKTATNTTITCSGATSTLILAASGQGQRNVFELTNGGANITLCRAATCTAGSGLFVASTTGSYSQDDSYWGAFSCVGSGASSTLGLIYSQ